MLANNISQAATIIKRGGVIAYSTETILGLGCDPFNKKAVASILWLKRRSPENGLILLVANLDRLKTFTQTLSREQCSLIEAALNEAPTTWLVPANKSVPAWIKGRHDKVAIRIAQHPIAKKLCDHCEAIVSTSANFSTYSTAINQQQLKDWFGPHLDYVMIGTLGTGSPSVVRDLVSGKTLRSNR